MKISTANIVHAVDAKISNDIGLEKVNFTKEQKEHILYILKYMDAVNYLAKNINKLEEK